MGDLNELAGSGKKVSNFDLRSTIEDFRFLIFVRPQAYFENHTSSIVDRKIGIHTLMLRLCYRAKSLHHSYKFRAVAFFVFSFR